MAFVAEDGTGLAAATSYISLAVANSHHADRGRDDWGAASDNDKQQALVRATDYIDQRFGMLFLGDKTSSDQALQWPRMGAYAASGFMLEDIPPQLQKACAEYALISLRQGELAPNPALPVADQSVADGTSASGESPQGEIISEKIGPIETEYQPSSTAKMSGSHKASQSAMVSNTILPEYPVADLWIADLLKSFSSYDLVRA